MTDETRLKTKADVTPETRQALRDRVRRMFRLGHSDVMISGQVGISIKGIVAWRRKSGLVRAPDSDLFGSGVPRFCAHPACGSVIKPESKTGVCIYHLHSRYCACNSCGEQSK